MEKNCVTSFITTERFTSIYEEYKSALMSFISYRIPNKYEAEDLMQDVFLRLLECGKPINPETEFSYLFTIARNLVNDTLRRHYIKGEVMDEWKYNNHTSFCTTEQTVEANELTSIYIFQIQQLPCQRRKVYEMVDCDDVSIPEVARNMSLSIRTVQNHLYIARNEIREKLSYWLKAV